jgi:hypothetical protein
MRRQAKWAVQFRLRLVERIVEVIEIMGGRTSGQLRFRRMETQGKWTVQLRLRRVE